MGPLPLQGGHSLFMPRSIAVPPLGPLAVRSAYGSPRDCRRHAHGNRRFRTCAGAAKNYFLGVHFSHVIVGCLLILHLFTPPMSPTLNLQLPRHRSVPIYFYYLLAWLLAHSWFRAASSEAMASRGSHFARQPPPVEQTQWPCPRAASTTGAHF